MEGKKKQWRKAWHALREGDREHEVFSDDSEFDIDKAHESFKEPRICIRYECVSMRLIKHVYKIKTHAQDGKFYDGKAPKSAFLNSSYDGSFIAGLLEWKAECSIWHMITDHDWKKWFSKNLAIT